MGCTLEITASTGPLSGSETRLIYLQDCVKFIFKSISEPFKAKKVWPKYDCFYQLLSLLDKELEGTLSNLEHVIANGETVNENFDIFEFSLMRYICQLNAMFIQAPESIVNTPSLLIEDPQARLIWEKLVGKEVHATDESFLLKVWPDLGKEENSHFKYSNEYALFEYAINFPRDNLITAYKWHCLNSQFGPFEELKANFIRFSSTGGFIGVVNTIQAAEILAQESVGTTLIRFSRLQPDNVTFTIKLNGTDPEPSSFRFKHIGKVVKEQLGVSSWQFINKSLDLSALKRVYSSTQYFKRNQPFHADIKEDEEYETY